MNEKNSQQPSTLGCRVRVITSGKGCMLAVAGRLGGCYVLVIGRVNTPKRCSPILRCAKDTFQNHFGHTIHGVQTNVQEDLLIYQYKISFSVVYKIHLHNCLETDHDPQLNNSLSMQHLFKRCPIDYQYYQYTLTKLDSSLIFSFWTFCCLFVAKCLGITASTDGSAPLSEMWLSQLDDQLIKWD